MHEFFFFCLRKNDAEIVVDLFHTLRREEKKKKDRVFLMLMPHHYFRVPRARPRHHFSLLRKLAESQRERREALYVSRLTTDDADVLDITFLIWRYLGLPRLGIFHLLVEGF